MRENTSKSTDRINRMEIKQNIKEISESIKRFSWKERGKSFIYASKGIANMIDEHNFRIHLTVMILVIAGGIILDISHVEWMLIFLSIGGVLAAETFNTAIEKLCDKVSPQQDPLIGKIKDLAAGAVLLFVFGAIATGLTIFIPAIIYFFCHA